MRTLQERLYILYGVSTLQEAADRIDALEAERDEYKMAAEAEARFADQYKAENAALRELVEMMAAQEGTAVFTTETRSRIDAARSKT